MFTKFEENVSVHQSLANEPNIDNGLSAEELKKAWDKPAEELKKAFNNLIDEITEETAARQIGAIQLEESDDSEDTVQGKLGYLLKTIQGISQGQIPDGTITKAKLDSEYSGSLAEKNGVLQVGLNTEMVAGETLTQILAHRNFVVGTYQGNKTNTPIEVDLGFKPHCVVIFHHIAGNTITDLSVAFENFSIGVSITENGFKTKSSDKVTYNSTHGYIAFK
jgi:hypothetical protein